MNSKFKNIAIGLVLLVWVAGTGWLGYQYWQSKTKVENNDAKVIVAKLKTLMEVPVEEPLVATITDAEKLKKDEQFYKNAVNGDKVVIWRDKAVIYRLKDNKIVDFGVVIRSPSKTEATPSATPAN